MELKLFLAWLTTAGAAWLTYKLIDEVPALKELGPKAKRRAAYVLVMESPLPGGVLKTARKGTGTFTVETIGRAAHALSLIHI